MKGQPDYLLRATVKMLAAGMGLAMVLYFLGHKSLAGDVALLTPWVVGFGVGMGLATGSRSE